MARVAAGWARRQPPRPRWRHAAAAWERPRCPPQVHAGCPAADPRCRAVSPRCPPQVHAQCQAPHPRCRAPPEVCRAPPPPRPPRPPTPRCPVRALEERRPSRRRHRSRPAVRMPLRPLRRAGLEPLRRLPHAGQGPRCPEVRARKALRHSPPELRGHPMLGQPRHPRFPRPPRPAATQRPPAVLASSSPTGRGPATRP
jgi:hypothetical protein